MQLPTCMSARQQVVKESNHRSTILKPAPELQQTSCAIKALNHYIGLRFRYIECFKTWKGWLEIFWWFCNNIKQCSASLHGRQQCVIMYLVQPLYECPAQLVPVQTVQDNSILMSHLASPPTTWRKSRKLSWGKTRIRRKLKKTTLQQQRGIRIRMIVIFGSRTTYMTTKNMEHHKSEDNQMSHFFYLFSDRFPLPSSSHPK